MTHAEIFAKQRAFFETGKTRDAAFRKAQLRRLDEAIVQHTDEILAALKQDLNKSRYEGYMAEVALVRSEIQHCIKKLSTWMRPKQKLASIAQMPAKTWIQYEPYGVVLILAPWNYPFQLSLNPLIGALAAGNCVCLKPSAYSAATSAVIEKLLAECFDPGYVSVATGGRDVNQALLEQPYDYLFFTGSPTVGRLVMRAAAEHLTPVTLELGGKSPCIVERTADLQKTARRILFGKLLNAGQTCVAPDFLYVEARIKEDLLEAIKEELKRQVPSEGYRQEHMAKIINAKHFERLCAYLDQGTILEGGQVDAKRQQLAFTLLDEPAWTSPVMQEEIFGPILPVLSFEDISEAIQQLKKLPKPLALYLFTKSQAVQDRVLTELSFGGGCVNDTIMHLTSNRLPFGGVGPSGMGHYHGAYSFETFSHAKSLVKKAWAMDMPMRYHPYRDPDKTLPQILF